MAYRKLLVILASLFLVCNSRSPLVCPQNCDKNCPDEEDETYLPSTENFVNFTCDIDGTTARFSYQPSSVALHLLDKVAIQKKVIDGFSNIAHLYMDNLDITNNDLPEDLLEARTSLQIISISGNKHLTHVPAKLFSGKDNLWAIVLDNNKLNQLPFSQLEHSNKLLRIFFRGNQIALSNTTFYEYSKLEWLYLSRNNITELPVTLIHSLKELTYFELDGNDISLIPDNFFIYSRKLRHLNLSGNKILFLSDSFSLGLVSVIRIDLSCNKIGNITENSFLSLINVQIITMNHNQLKSINDLCFYWSIELLELDLSDNKLNISRFPRFASSRLMLLNLSNNAIVDFHDSYPNCDQQFFVDFDLSGNNITHLDIEQFKCVINSDKSSQVVGNYNYKRGRPRTYGQVQLQDNPIKSLNLQWMKNKLIPHPTYFYLNNTLFDCYIAELYCKHLTNQTGAVFVTKDQSVCQKTGDKCRDIDDKKCPQNCTCLFIDYNDMDCYSGNLTLVPMGVYNVQRLKMDDNDLSDLSSFHLHKSWQNLTHLRLNYCNINSAMLIDVSSGESMLDKLEKLEKLSMTHNAIQVLPKHFVSNLRNLWFLDLSHNLIEEIPINFFEDNDNLQILSLAYNKLTTIDNLNPLINLQYLNTKFNHLSEILQSVITGLANLTELDLTSNNVSQVTNLNWPHKLKLLSLKDNKVNTIDNFNFPRSLTRLDLSGNNISVLSFQHLYLPNEFFLDVRNNIIRDISVAFSTHLKKESVYTVYVRNNKLICDCNSISFIDHYTNRKKEVGVEFPEVMLQCAQPKNFPISLVSINDKCVCPIHCSCSPIQLICTQIPVQGIFIDTFLNKKLILNNINLSTISLLRKILRSGLNALEITSGTNGTSSEILSFQLGENTLKLFKFTNNSVTSLPPNFLHNATDLEVLDLSNNQIMDIADNFFSATVKIKTLNLAGNRLRAISDIVFAKLGSLRTLNLGYNKISVVTENMLVNCRQLGEISLNNNSITSINENSFAHQIGTLTSINIKGNIIGKEEFSKMKLPDSLIELNIACNEISQFIPNDPPHLINLKELDISNNKITEISIENILKYPNAIVINFENNDVTDIKYNPGMSNNIKSKDLSSIVLNKPINCNCKIKWIVECLNSEDHSSCPVKIIGKDLTCKTPTELEGTFVQNIDETNLKCNLPHDCVNTGCSCFFQNGLNNVNCSYRNLTSLPDVAMQNIEVLHLDGNTNLSLSKLKSDEWKNLKFLYVSYCKNFTLTVSDDPFSSNLNLTVLWMMHDGIDEITNELFYHLKNLIELNLSGNNLEFLNLVTFLGNLQKLNVRDNRLLFLNNDLSKNMPNIQYIDASFNQLTRFVTRLATSVKTLNLSHNNITDFSTNVDILLLDLSYNKLKKHNVTNCNRCETYLNDNELEILHFPNDSNHEISTIHLFNNPLSCYCLVKERTAVISNIKFITDENCSIKYSKKFGISLPKNICQVLSNCDDRCTCMKNMDLQNVTMQCSESNLTYLPSSAPANVTWLKIHYNKIPTLQGLADKQWVNLQVLHLDYNYINKLVDEVLPPNIKEISLAYNKIATPSGWLEKFVTNSISNVEKMYLGHNPWLCECNNEPFQKWLIRFGKKTVSDFYSVKCDGTNNELINIDLCFETWTIIGPVLSCVLILAIVSIVFLSFYCSNRQAVHVFLYGHCFCCKWCISRDDIDIDKQYDAFISYSSEDTDFIVEHLIPELENKPPNFKLCIHERDWNIGEQILDQIEKSVTSSKRVIVILSENFMQSMWSSLEFKTAHYYSIKDKVNRIIVIVVGDLPPKETLDADLRMYINLNTYLKWGDPRFWSKLKYAMPRKAVAKKEIA